jgi:hypothetical protein
VQLIDDHVLDPVRDWNGVIELVTPELVLRDAAGLAARVPWLRHPLRIHDQRATHDAIELTWISGVRGAARVHVPPAHLRPRVQVRAIGHLPTFLAHAVHVGGTNEVREPKLRMILRARAPHAIFTLSKREDRFGLVDARPVVGDIAAARTPEDDLDRLSMGSPDREAQPELRLRGARLRSARLRSEDGASAQAAEVRQVVALLGVWSIRQGEGSVQRVMSQPVLFRDDALAVQPQGTVQDHAPVELLAELGGRQLDVGFEHHRAITAERLAHGLLRPGRAVPTRVVPTTPEPNVLKDPPPQPRVVDEFHDGPD